MNATKEARQSKRANPNNHMITRLVVGEAFVQSMGTPVGQRSLFNQDVSQTIRWKHGRWENSEGLVSKLRKAASQSSDVLNLPISAPKEEDTVEFNFLEYAENLLTNPKVKRGIYIASLTLASLFLGISGYFLYDQLKSADIDLPIPLGAGGPSNVSSQSGLKVEEAPFFVRPLEAGDAGTNPTAERPVVPSANAVEPAGVLPIPSSGSAPAGVATQAAPASPIIPAPVANSSTVAPVIANAANGPTGAKNAGKNETPAAPATPAKTDGKAPPPTGMILDAENAKGASSESSSKEPAKEPPKVRSGGSGLVAITPDGKIALFTNPKTRLPERFKVGDKLPSGETLKSIDTSSGKVVTDSKEYVLE